ncbi:hypothetical protein KQI30_03990 [Clostridium bornimense]|uniref:guanylate kinase n=1 Tax=Clostridium bornimense TaxID=1216932 RepID=UPI001C116801|nr:hypothetical protein [Clostridium bornimense]MBU5315438.1 hypothetical protein [Clostridium bornimense]
MTIFTLTGPSASGKTSLANFLSGENIDLEINKENRDRLKKIGILNKCITSTTRLPRSGETNHVDYHFYNKKDFIAKINNNEFIEYTEVYNNFYGLTKEEVKVQTANGKSIILVMDPKGAETIKNIYKNHVIQIFIDVSLDNIEKRMKFNRKQGDAELKERLEDLQYFYDFRDKCDYILNGNDDINTVFDKALTIIKENIDK